VFAGEGFPGRVSAGMKTRWRNGTTHLVISPQEFMEQ
jgi:hypothetical protein